MKPSSPQKELLLFWATTHSSRGVPPEASTTQRRPEAKKESRLPSGEKLGPSAPSLLSTGICSKLSSRRITRVLSVVPSRNAIVEPSGEIAK
jgi:hypothetical protein